MRSNIPTLHTPAASIPESALLPALDQQPKDCTVAQREPRRRGSAAGRAILHEAWVRLPGVERLRSR